MAEEQTDIATDAPDAVAVPEAAAPVVEDHGVESAPVVEDPKADEDEDEKDKDEDDEVDASLPVALPEGVELR